MADAPLILGVSGLRGIVGESLTPEVAVRYAGAFGEWLLERHQIAAVGVARDGRAGGEQMYASAIAGLLGVGCRVVELGVVTTPTAGYAVRAEGLSGCLIVTASHNPQEWNGLKALVADQMEPEGDEWVEHEGRAPTLREADEIIKIFRAGPRYGASTFGKLVVSADEPAFGHWDSVLWWYGEIAGRTNLGDGYEQYRGILSKLLGRRVRCVVDAVNSSGSTVAVPFLDAVGEVIQIHCNGTGEFPHTPEPTRENLSGEGGLCDAVPGLKADIGFAQDPDADRLAIVDEKGQYIGEEYTLVLCAAALMEARKEDGLEARPTKEKPVFVVNLSTSRMIDDVAARYGAEVVRTPVGEANVVEAMKRLKAEGRDVVMGGEGNGGVIWPEVTYVRDSLSAMALTLALMARTGKKVSELVAMIDAMGPGGKGYAILKRKAPLASKADAVPVVEHLARVYRDDPDAAVDTQDGVRIDWPARGVWAHVRASNTEPIMRVIVEAPTEAEAEETARAVEGRIAEV